MTSSPLPLPRNPHSHRLHRRDRGLQVYLPIGLAVAGALALIVLTLLAGLGIVGSRAGASTWADVSLIFLIVIALAMGLAPLALLAGLAYGMRYALRYLPGYARIAQIYASQISHWAREIADQAAKPVVAVRRGSAAVGGAVKGLTERTSNDGSRTNGRTRRNGA